MNEPHAKCYNGSIYWRGTDDWFRYMTPETAIRLVGRAMLPDALQADLAEAVRQQDEFNIQLHLGKVDA